MNNIKKIIASDGVTCMSFVPDIGGMGSSLVMPGKHGPRELLYLHDCPDLTGSRIGVRDDNTEPVIPASSAVIPASSAVIPASSAVIPAPEPGSSQKAIADLIGGWPFCFPVCARLSCEGEEGVYVYKDQRYDMKIHGVSWYLPWQVITEEPSRLVLQLEANDHTRKIYPFEFCVTLDYQIAPGKLACLQTYVNCGDQEMPYYAGFHPYFLTPPVDDGKADVMVDFRSDYRLQYNAELTDIIGQQSPINWPASASEPAINEQLSHVDGDNVFQLRYPDGDCVTMSCWSEDDAEMFPYIQTYTMADRPFVCVEPWMDHPNAINTAGACRWLQAGQSETAMMELVLSREN
ncbi:MAG: aldose epimerase [Coxiellaceae bacterium]|nr:aldose epimerase [Coxiellaceae bacterium]